MIQRGATCLGKSGGTWGRRRGGFALGVAAWLGGLVLGPALGAQADKGAQATGAQVAPATKDPLKIMRAVRDRDVGDRMVAKVRMVITGAGAKRERAFTLKSLQVEDGSKRMFLFEAPAEVRGTGLLIYEYHRPEREADQWLYLPALKQTSRITAGRRSGAFVGSDFSFADLTQPDPEDYAHRLLREEEVQGEACWVIESTPKTPEVENKVGYQTVQTWVAKASLLPLRVKGAMSGGRTKYIAATGVKRIQGIPTPTVLTARVVDDGKVQSQTVLYQADTQYGVDELNEATFTVQRLERGL